MVAVFGEKVIGCALKFLGSLVRLVSRAEAFPVMTLAYLLYYGLEFFCWSEGKAVQNSLLESATGRFLARLRPVYASQVPPVVSAICIFPVANNDARVQQRAANGPQYSCNFARGKEVVDVDKDLCPLERKSTPVVARGFAGGLGAGGGG